MTLQEEIMTKYNDTVRKNVRKVHELEYIMQKYTKVVDIAE